MCSLSCPAQCCCPEAWGLTDLSGKMCKTCSPFQESQRLDHPSAVSPCTSDFTSAGTFVCCSWDPNKHGPPAQRPPSFVRKCSHQILPALPTTSWTLLRTEPGCWVLFIPSSQSAHCSSQCLERLSSRDSITWLFCSWLPGSANGNDWSEIREGRRR